MSLLRRLHYVWRNFDHPLADDCIALNDKLAIVQREREYAWGEKNRLLGEVVALRHALADLGRQLHAAQTGPLGDTAPMPRTRSAAPVAHDHGGELVAPWPPAEWLR